MIEYWQGTFEWPSVLTHLRGCYITICTINIYRDFKELYHTIKTVERNTFTTYYRQDDSYVCAGHYHHRLVQKSMPRLIRAGLSGSLIRLGFGGSAAQPKLQVPSCISPAYYYESRYSTSNPSSRTNSQWLVV